VIADLISLSQDADVDMIPIVHPRPVPWHTIIAPMATTLGVSTVPFSTWIEKLSDADVKGRTAKEVPALLLAGFYREMQRKEQWGQDVDNANAEEDRGNQSVMPNQTASAISQVSPTLVNLMEAPLTPTDVLRWIAFWQKVGVM
jgi:hypothetical protein